MLAWQETAESIFIAALMQLFFGVTPVIMILGDNEVVVGMEY